MTLKINSGKLHVRFLKDGFLRIALYQMSQYEIQIGQSNALSSSLILGLQFSPTIKVRTFCFFNNLSYQYSFVVLTFSTWWVDYRYGENTREYVEYTFADSRQGSVSLLGDCVLL